jgi:hypothetical protein
MRRHRVGEVAARFWFSTQSRWSSRGSGVGRSIFPVSDSTSVVRLYHPKPVFLRPPVPVQPKEPRIAQKCADVVVGVVQPVFRRQPQPNQRQIEFHDPPLSWYASPGGRQTPEARHLLMDLPCFLPQLPDFAANRLGKLGGFKRSQLRFHAFHETSETAGVGAALHLTSSVAPSTRFPGVMSAISAWRGGRLQPDPTRPRIGAAGPNTFPPSP